jgi:hypothetical protein
MPKQTAQPTQIKTATGSVHPLWLKYPGVRVTDAKYFVWMDSDNTQPDDTLAPTLTKVKNCATKREAKECVKYLNAEVSAGFSFGEYACPRYHIAKKGRQTYACFCFTPDACGQYTLKSCRREDAMCWLSKELGKASKRMCKSLAERKDPDTPFFIECPAPEDAPENRTGSPHERWLCDALILNRDVLRRRTQRILREGYNHEFLYPSDDE